MSARTLTILAGLSLPLTSANAALSTQGSEADAFDGQEISVVEKRLPADAVGQKKLSLEVGTAPGFRLDTTLATLPGVTLFRRADSLTGHPTTQGLSMRGVGVSAAGRVLVTLDGVPMGDPFGGWVYWSALDAFELSDMQVKPGGSAGAYGAQALAGVVDIRSRSISSMQPGLDAWYGSDDSFSIKARAGFEVAETGLAIAGGHFRTDGDYLLSPADRGAVDVRAASKASFASMKAEHDFGGVEARGTLRYFREERVNGLALATNATEAMDASLTLSGDAGEGAWEVVSYYRTRDFANVFSSARDERTSELAVLDQYDVPAWGAGMLARLQFDGFEFGIDGRRMSGETNERFRNLGTGFTRDRTAGGDQWTLGAYGEAETKLGEATLSATLRLDRWRSYNGSRIESDSVSGDVLRDDVVPNKGGWQPSARLGAVVPVTGAIDLRAAAYRSWRLPTLNEYYRPFRVVNDITEANPDLVPEKLYGLEIGADYEPLNTFRASITYFRNWLRDGVGNVTIGFGPGFFPLGGFVPEGGVLRQRANIDASVTDGIELEGELKLQPGWTLGARYQYARARITAFDAMPDLVGNRPVQTPKHGLNLSLAYEDGGPLSARAQVRYASGQYDDDLNTRKLDSIVTFDARADYRVAKGVTLFTDIRNLFDAKVVSAVTEDGLETLAQRRFWRVGVTVDF
ncbi:TonB-dependent receptor [Kordiimonas gwangyangensis]|uniref:TonB-dependent receptor n=1 Tax=Kordiimonas gwangyangensis TaxID=288022 RepID=UPI0009DB6C74|nr:TonB-dependent receptor [Kordiimonas gwangyangensis]